MRVLITGALGHIGSRLIREIEATDVLLVDDLSTDRFCSLTWLPDHINYRFVQRDLVRCKLNKLMDNVDCVVHLAGRTDAEKSLQQENKKDYWFNNRLVTLRISDRCAGMGIPLINVSTTSIYGMSMGLVDETSLPSPQSIYAESKLEAERCFSDRTDLRFINLRFGTIYGSSPGMRFHTVVNKFCWQAMTRQPISIYEDAVDKLRPYLYLGDAIAAINFIIRTQLYDNETYNIVSGNHTPIDVVRVIEEYIPLEYRLTGSKILSQYSYEVSTMKASGAGFEFTGTLRQGIEETLKQWGCLNEAVLSRRFGNYIPR